MNHASRPEELRALELLADRAAFGLSTDDAAELTQLLRSLPNLDIDAIDRAATTVELAFANLPGAAKTEPLPEALREKIAASAAKHVLATPRPKREFTDSEPRVSPSVGRDSNPIINHWFVIAASLLIVAGVLYFSRMQLSTTLNPARGYVALLADRDRPSREIVSAKWTATPDPHAQGAGGDVVWSGADQRGYMRFHNLAANDPKKEQYQLWIFDAAQNEKYPIDGGVFDIDPANRDPKTGDFIVPINAKLKVVKPVMFAVTVENPGGVVVSDRSQLPLLAKVE